MPYFTCELEAWSVVQVMVTELEVIAPAVTAEMTGGGGADPAVENVKLAEVVEPPVLLVETAA